MKYAPQVGDVELCDNFLKEGWYRIKSKAGDRMPTTCPSLGFKCCTTNPLWLSDGNIAFHITDLFSLFALKKVSSSMY